MDMKKKVSYLLGIIFIITSLFPCSLIFAKSGAGGYNEYRSRRYGDSAESVDKLEQVLSEDGYIECNPDNNWLDLDKVDAFKYSALLSDNNYVDYHIWVDKRDLENYKNATDQTIHTELSILQDNAVICAYYEWNIKNRDSENPQGKTGNEIPEDWETGTLIINVENDTDTQTDVIVTLLRNEDKEYYAIRVNKVNGYTATTVVPIGTYFVYSVFLNDKYIAKYDPTFGIDGDGFYMHQNDVMSFTVGFGVKELPPASWQDTTEKYVIPITTQSPNSIFIDDDTDTGNVPDMPVVEETPTDNKKIAIIILCVIGGVLLIGGIVAFLWYKRYKDENF